MYTTKSMLSITAPSTKGARAVPHGLSDVGIQGHVSLRLRQEERGKEVNPGRPKPELRPMEWMSTSIMHRTPVVVPRCEVAMRSERKKTRLV